jgi:hypothetical protein
MPTPLRNVRVPDDLWAAALARASSEGRTLSDVVRRLLEQYVGEPEPNRAPVD